MPWCELRIFVRPLRKPLLFPVAALSPSFLASDFAASACLSPSFLASEAFDWAFFAAPSTLGASTFGVAGAGAAVEDDGAAPSMRAMRPCCGAGWAGAG